MAASVPVAFAPDQIKENLEALVGDLRKAKPASAKGHYLKKITLSTTMGPGLHIDESSLAVSLQWPCDLNRNR